MSTASESYRPDIDGLRAIAVLSVFIYHLHASWLPGGFLGVDVFFVISGYLISSHIFSAALAGQFSFMHFYHRRINRILPALFGVIALTGLATSLLYLPDDFARVAKSATKALTFTANAFFAKQDDYFAHATAELPLLNLWSLSVEEQFYLFLPAIIVLVLARVGMRQRQFLIIGMVLCSLLYSEHLLRSGQTKFAYYYTLSRASELLVGTWLATVKARSLSPIFRQAAGGLGILALAICFERISSGSHFPGLMSLAPSLASALLIFAGAGRSDEHSWVSKFLSLRPLVFVGLISYSLYLFHWPIMAITRYFTFEDDFSPFTMFIVSSASFVLATLSWRFIETPFRRNSSNFSHVFLIRFLAPSLVGLAFFALITKTQGLPQRYGSRQNAVVNTLTFPKFCHEYFDNNNVEACRFGDKAKKSRILLLGDSIMGNYQAAFNEVGKAQGFSFIARSVGACYPVIQLPGEPLPLQTRSDCLEQVAWADQHIDDFDTIVFAGNWKGYEELPSFPVYSSYLERSIQRLIARHKNVVLLEEPPKCPGVLKFYRQNFSLIGDWLGQSQSKIECNQTTLDANAHLAALAERTGAHYLPIVTQFTASEALPFSSERYFYFDDEHFNEPGALELGHFLARKTDFARLWVASWNSRIPGDTYTWVQ